MPMDGLNHLEITTVILAALRTQPRIDNIQIILTALIIRPMLIQCSFAFCHGCDNFVTLPVYLLVRILRLFTKAASLYRRKKLK